MYYCAVLDIDMHHHTRKMVPAEDVQNISLNADEVQLVGGEVIISRTRYVPAQTEKKACCRPVSLANAHDFGEWISAPLHAFSTSHQARPRNVISRV
jgi:pre-mRNA-splicing helicase BRR2